MQPGRARTSGLGVPLLPLARWVGWVAPVRPTHGVLVFPVPRPPYVCAVSWAAWLLFIGVPARFAVLRLRCPRQLGSCSPVCSLGVLCCVCGVLGHLAPVHRCARCVRCACLWACVFAFCSPRGLFLCLSLAPLFSLACFAFFFRGGDGFGAVRGCGCVPVPVLVWAWVSPGTGVRWLLRSGFPVCAPAPRLPVSGAPVRGVLTAGGWRQWWRGACLGGRGSWVVLGWRGRARACVWVCSWRGLMGWWAVWAWLVCVGVGYVCAEEAVGWAGAPWAMEWVEEMLVTPTGGVL